MSSTATIFAELQNFTVTPTCTNVWTERYACPLCAGEAIPLCAEICDDVLIGCMSSLQQVIVQLNALLEFANGMKVLAFVCAYVWTTCCKNGSACA